VRSGIKGLVRDRSRLPDDRIAAVNGAMAIRFALIRVALQRRDNIPELVVLALEQTRDRE
jgi:hypothetical protein